MQQCIVHSKSCLTERDVYVHGKQNLFSVNVDTGTFGREIPLHSEMFVTGSLSLFHANHLLLQAEVLASTILS